jgi:hypothetical protein
MAFLTEANSSIEKNDALHIKGKNREAGVNYNYSPLGKHQQQKEQTQLHTLQINP